MNKKIVIDIGESVERIKVLPLMCISREFISPVLPHLERT